MSESAPENQGGDLVVEFLQKHDAACPRCGYSVKGLVEGKCPECGEGLELSLATESKPMRAWFAGMFGLVSGFGFQLHIMGIFLWVWFDNGFFSSDLWPGVGVSMIGSVMMLGLQALWWLGRDWLGQRGKFVRCGLSLGCWVVSVGATVVLFWLID